MQDEQHPEHISPSNHQTTTTTRQEDNIQVDEDHELAQIEDAVIDILKRIDIVHPRGLAYGYVAALESLHTFLDRLYDGKQYQHKHNILHHCETTATTMTATIVPPTQPCSYLIPYPMPLNQWIEC